MIHKMRFFLNFYLWPQFWKILLHLCMQQFFLDFVSCYMLFSTNIVCVHCSKYEYLSKRVFKICTLTSTDEFFNFWNKTVCNFLMWAAGVIHKQKSSATENKKKKYLNWIKSFNGLIKYIQIYHKNLAGINFDSIKVS